MFRAIIIILLALFLKANENSPNDYVCGIFPSVLVSYNNINVNGNNIRVCGSNSVYSKSYTNNNHLKCSYNVKCGNLILCSRKDPPLNKYNPFFVESKKTTPIPTDYNFTRSDYKDYNFNNGNIVLNFNPTKIYSDNNKKYMTLGSFTFDKDNYTLNFSAGDYYFDQLIFNGGNIHINLPSNGIVRIFVKHDLNFNKGGIFINSNGNAKNLFIYVGGNLNISPSGDNRDVIIKSFLYVKGDFSINPNSNDAEFYGGFTAEGNINLNGNNLNFYYVGNPSELGYGRCPLCYALNNNGKWISFEGLNAYFDFPRKIGIINDSNDTLYDLNVSQIETNPSWLSITSPEKYALKDSFDNIVYKPIKNTIVYSLNVPYVGTKTYSHTKEGNGSVTRWAPNFNISGIFDTKIITTADFGDYNLSGFNSYYSIDTYGISGNFKGNRNLTYYATYYDDKKRRYKVQLDYCNIKKIKHYHHRIIFFDAWDDRHSVLNRRISTKIVNKEFNLTIASLNLEMNKTKVFPLREVKYRLFDMTHSIPLTQWREFNASKYPFIKDTFLVKKAVKNVRVQFQFCEKKYVRPIAIVPLRLCEINPNSFEYNTSFSSDNFAIRPYGFRIFSNKEYKRAGENFNITIKAVDESNYSLNFGNVNSVKGVKDYNESVDNLTLEAKFYTPSEKEIRQMNLDIYDKNDTNMTKVAFCPDKGYFSVVGDKYFKNGELNTTVNYSESGVLEITVKETPNKEFAYVDKNDTPDNLRYIKPSHFIYDIDDINKTNLLLFIPYKFTTTAEYFTTPYNPNNWVYISNEVNKSNVTYQIPKMAAVIRYLIKAYSKDNRLLKNYTKTCFADYTSNAPTRNGLKLNTTFDLFLDFILKSTQNTDISLFVTDNNNRPIWTMNKKVNLLEGENKIKEWINSLSFNEGEGIANIYFNIDKNYRIPQKEVNITLEEVNSSTSWMNNPYATHIFIGKEINKTIRFLYGRIDIKNISTIGNEANSTFKYEYWDDFYGWILNKEHNSTFGDINVSKCLIPSDISLNPQEIQKGIEKIVIETNHSLPYVVKLHFSVPEWLWYHPLAKDYKDPSKTNLDCLTHPCMNVEFRKYSKGWGGAGVNNPKYKETNRTVKINSSSKIKANKSEINRVNW